MRDPYLQEQTQGASANEPHEGIILQWPVLFYLSFTFFCYFNCMATPSSTILSYCPYFKDHITCRSFFKDQIVDYSQFSLR